jgi:AcrR family transcriptional regulator
MKDYSGFYSHMSPVQGNTLEARKTPVQARSEATVEAIYEAAIQVLLREGPERLTTTRVAERAGVSVGTLYQYYPNKKALLHAVLELHLGKVVSALVGACEASHGRTLREMVEAMVTAFVDAKVERKDVSKALYAMSAELEGEAIMAGMRKRSQAACVAMLKTVPGVKASEVDFAVRMWMAAMSGTMRTVLEAGASRQMVEDLRRHLVVMGVGYLCELIA